MDLLLTKSALGELRAADEATTQALQKIGAGEIVRAKISRPRNIKMHRLFFALLQVVWQNLPESMAEKIPTIDRLLWEIKLQTGRFDLHETLGGKMVPVPASISFAAMEQAEFDEFFADAMRVIRKFIMPGITDAELRRAVDEEIGKYG